MRNINVEKAPLKSHKLYFNKKKSNKKYITSRQVETTRNEYP